MYRKYIPSMTSSIQYFPSESDLDTCNIYLVLRVELAKFYILNQSKISLYKLIERSSFVIINKIIIQKEGKKNIGLLIWQKKKGKKEGTRWCIDLLRPYHNSKNLVLSFYINKSWTWSDGYLQFKYAYGGDRLVY